MVCFLLQPELPSASRSKSGKLLIGISLKFEKLSIQTESMSLETSFSLSLTWYDSRLLLFNLNDNFALNVLPNNGSLWIPTISFVNCPSHDSTVSDDRMELHAQRKRSSNMIDESAHEQREFISEYISLLMPCTNEVPSPGASKINVIPKVYLSISKLHSILAVMNLFVHDNISQSLGVTFILLAMVHVLKKLGFMNNFILYFRDNLLGI